MRSIQQVNADGSLKFFCAIEPGLVLTLGRAGDLAESLKRSLAEVAEGVPGLELVLGCECILRRIEIAENRLERAVRKILAPYPFIGFNTYGEQFGGCT